MRSGEHVRHVGCVCQATVYKIVLMNGGLAEYEQILKTYHDTTDNHEKKYALLSLGATQVEALKQRTLDWTTKSGEVKLQDFFYAYGRCGSV